MKKGVRYCIPFFNNRSFDQFFIIIAHLSSRKKDEAERNVIENYELGI